MLVTCSILFSGTVVLAQDEEEKEKPRPERKAFESAVLLDNQTDVINGSKTLEWNIQHRFGTVRNGSSDLWGVFDLDRYLTGGGIVARAIDDD